MYKGMDAKEVAKRYVLTSKIPPQIHAKREQKVLAAQAVDFVVRNRRCYTRP